MKMTFEEMAKARYSVKKFKSTPVEEEKLNKILEVAALAPTARNKQSFRIYVLKSDEALEKANSLTRCVYGAPVCLMFTYNIEETYPYIEDQGLSSGDEDCSIAATHVMFEALEQGLGTCWVNAFTPSKAKALFNLPDDEYVVLFMPVGYADAEPLPNHELSKPLEDIVTVL